MRLSGGLRRQREHPEVAWGPGPAERQYEVDDDEDFGELEPRRLGIELGDRIEQGSAEARAKAESAYDAEQCAASHIRLYEELLDREPHRPVRRQRDLISSV